MFTEHAVHQRFSRLLAEAAHDIRAPIAAAQQVVRSVMQRLHSEDGEPLPEVELLHLADGRLAMARRWATEILDLQRLDKTPPIRLRFFTEQWRTQIQGLFESIAAEHCVRLLWVGWDRSLPRLYLDPSHLTRAVMNLLVNACQASPKGGQVILRAQWSGPQQMLIEVEDQGRGISNSMLQRVHATAHESSLSGLCETVRDCGEMPKSGGNGLGLEIAGRLVRRMGGRLHGRALRPAGSSLCVTLPIDDLAGLLPDWLTSPQPWGAWSSLATRPERVYCAAMGLQVTTALQLADVEHVLYRHMLDCEWTYRIASNRWLLFSILKCEDEQQQDAETLFCRDRAQMLNSLLAKAAHNTTSIRLKPLAGSLPILTRLDSLELSEVDKQSGLFAARVRIAQQLCDQLRKLQRGTALPLDDLAGLSPESPERQSLTTGTGKFYRWDQAQANQLERRSSSSSNSSRLTSGLHRHRSGWVPATPRETCMSVGSK